MKEQHHSEIHAQGFNYRTDRGYLIVDHDGTGMLEVQRDDSKNIFPDDDAAAKQAALDGIPIIPTEDLPRKFPMRHFGWIDAPDNRTRIEAYAANRERREELERLTYKNWKKLPPWDCCGEGCRCDRECRFNDECREECDTLRLYRRLAEYEDTGLEPKEVWLVIAALTGKELVKISEIEDVPVSRLVEIAKAEKDNGPLTTEELWNMGGQPVWCVDGAGHEAWCLIDASGGKELRRAPDAIDSDTGLWDGDFYNMESATEKGLHGKGWLAYRRKPEGGKDNA